MGLSTVIYEIHSLREASNVIYCHEISGLDLKW